MQQQEENRDRNDDMYQLSTINQPNRCCNCKATVTVTVSVNLDTATIALQQILGADAMLSISLNKVRSELS